MGWNMLVVLFMFGVCVGVVVKVGYGWVIFVFYMVFFYLVVQYDFYYMLVGFQEGKNRSYKVF